MLSGAFAIGALALLGCPGVADEDDPDPNARDTDRGGGEVEDSDDPPPTEDCQNGRDDDDDGAFDCDDRDCAYDPACEVYTWEPAFVTSSGFFAYDAETREVVSGWGGGRELAPTVVVVLASQAMIDGQNGSEYCEIVLTGEPGAALPLQAWSFTYEGASYTHAGFTMPDGGYTVSHTCEELDTTVLGTPEEIAALGWGVTVGTLHPDVEQWLLDQLGEVGDYVGGGTYWTSLAEAPELGLPDGVSPSGYGRGYQIDGYYRILTPEGLPANDVDLRNDNVAVLPGEDLRAGGALATGFYETEYGFGWFLEP
jgi:hypothetical protein